VILRLTAALALAASLALVLAYLHLVGQGPFASAASRHLRAMKQRTTVPAAAVPCRFADIAALPHGAALATYAPLERRAVSLDGYVAGMMRSSDGDLHLEITAIPRMAGSRETLYVTGEVTPAFQRGGGWNLERLSQAFLPISVGPVFDRATRRVRIEGWLLYDWQYDGRPAHDPMRELWNHINPTRRHNPVRRHASSIWPRLSGWEIHPVTGIEVWDDAAGAFRRLEP
jgi:hypothetical protein